MSIEVPAGKDLNLQFWLSGLTPQMLQVTYDVENVAESDIYLFNRLYRGRTEAGEFAVDPNLVYISLEDGAVHLTKRIPDVPEDIDVLYYIIPCATLLPRGERFSETLSLALPLSPFNPYRPQPEAVATQTFRTLVFSLGYFKAAELGRRTVNWVSSTEGEALYVYASPLDQLVVRAAPITAMVPVQG